MSNFGFVDLRVVGAWQAAWNEAKSAMGGVSVLRSAVEFDSVAEAIADCALVVGTASVGAREMRLAVRRLERAGEEIRRAEGRVAILFGSEKTGLSNEDLSHCHWLLRIPTRTEHESMNLGQAVAVVLYELARDAEASDAAPRSRRVASSEDLDRIEDRLWTLLVESGYTNERTMESSRMKLRRLLRRMNIGDRDASVWLGMLRQMLWKWKR